MTREELQRAAERVVGPNPPPLTIAAQQAVRTHVVPHLPMKTQARKTQRVKKAA